MALRIVADENMPNVEAWLSKIASSIIRKPGRTLAAEDLTHTDVLLVRSVTQVNESLISNSPIRFVGSATIGTDHIDQTYLANKNILFQHAPGCNAQSVADWLLSVLSRIHIDYDVQWWRKTIAVVGVGHVGFTVVETLARFGCRILVCDPPKHSEGLLPEHQPLSEVMSQADIVCFHVPHTKEGSWPTHKMIGDEQLNWLKPGAWLINAGRGPVFQRDPLVAKAEAGRLNLVLDVWPEEPQIDAALLGITKLSSPHVAGYSLEGKYKGTEMLAQAVFDYFQLDSVEPPALPKGLTIDASLYAQDDIELWVSELVLAVYDPARDTATMSASIHDGVIEADMFDQLRKAYPVRRELASTTLVKAPEAVIEWAQRFGFCRA